MYSRWKPLGTRLANHKPQSIQWTNQTAEKGRTGVSLARTRGRRMWSHSCVSIIWNCSRGVQFKGLKFRLVSSEFLKYDQRNSRISYRINQGLQLSYILPELDRSHKRPQIGKNECRKYQPGFACHDVHRHVNLRNQDLLHSNHCVEYADKTCTFGCDDTSAAENWWSESVHDHSKGWKSTGAARKRRMTLLRM